MAPRFSISNCTAWPAFTKSNLSLSLFSNGPRGTRPTKEVSFQQEENNKVVELLLRLRMLRVFIALWNVVVLFLMVVYVTPQALCLQSELVFYSVANHLLPLAPKACLAAEK